MPQPPPRPPQAPCTGAGRQRGATGPSHTALLGFVCMGGTPSATLLAQTPKLGVPPIHIKPTRWPYGGICRRILPPWCPCVEYHGFMGYPAWFYRLHASIWVSGSIRLYWGYPPYIQNQPGGHVGLYVGSTHPPDAPVPRIAAPHRPLFPIRSAKVLQRSSVVAFFLQRWSVVTWGKG